MSRKRIAIASLNFGNKRSLVKDLDEATGLSEKRGARGRR